MKNKSLIFIFINYWLAVSTIATAAPGTLLGYSIIDYGVNEKPLSVATQKSDGKILIAGKVDGAVGTDWLLARLNADLTFDTTFAGIGYLTKDFLGNYDKATKIAMVDGNIMVAGLSTEAVNRITLARLLPDGTFDPSFGNAANHDGIAMHCYDISGSDILPIDLAYDGTNFWMSGSWLNYALPSDMIFGRIFADGIPDQALGPNNGCHITQLPGLPHGDRVAKISARFPGYITLVGSNGATPVAYRVHANDDPGGAFMAGDPDVSFGVNGWAQADNPILNHTTQVRAGHVQKNGKVLIAGYIVTTGSFIMRRQADGSRDPGFGSNADGLVVFNAGLANIGQPQVIKVDKWGHIYVAGYTESFPVSNLFIARFNADGSLDTGFGIDGIAATPITADTDYIYDIAFDGNNNVIAVGKSNGNLLVARFQGGL